MGCFGKFAVAGVLAVLFAVSAQAADMPRLPMPLSDKTPVIVEEFSSGWYLRGDVGYRLNNRIGSATSFIPPDPTENKLDKSMMFGGGVGYKAKWFRADITAEYGSRAKYWGSVAGVPTYTTRIDGFTTLLNGYFDLGTWAGITPYIGAGAGGSYLSGADYMGPFPQAVPPPVVSKWTFSWAYMAGVSFALHPNFLLDVGYRHINLGDAVSGLDSNRLTLKNISADEIRVGLRYLLD
jgi:opacity protein-like surface antigen